MKSFSARIDLIGPKRAREILENHNYADNRRISPQWVSHLARQMKNGMWCLNGESIVFDTADNLLDGQHRLSAVIESGKAVRFLIVRGVKTDTFTTLDQGRGRSAGAVFGMVGEKHSHLLAAVCRKIWCWEVLGSLAGKVRVSWGELNLVLARYPEVREAVQVAQKVIGKRVPVDGSTVAFCYWLFAKAKPKKAAAFFDALRSGVATYENDPPVVLRDRLFRERREHRRRWGATELMTVFIRAWNYYCKGESVKNLAIKPGQNGMFRIPAVAGLGRDQQKKGAREGVESYTDEILALQTLEGS